MLLEGRIANYQIDKLLDGVFRVKKLRLKKIKLVSYKKFQNNVRIDVQF